MPLHARGGIVIRLHAIHSYVSLPRLWIARKDQLERYEPAAILRPAFQNRKVEQVHVVPVTPHFLAVSGLHRLREKRAQLRQLRQHLDLVEQSPWRLHIQKSSNPRRHLIESSHLKRQAHPPHAPKSVHQQRHPRSPRFFKQQRRTLCASHSLRELGYLQNRLHFPPNALHVPFLLQLPHNLPQIPIHHTSSRTLANDWSTRTANSSTKLTVTHPCALDPEVPLLAMDLGCGSLS